MADFAAQQPAGIVVIFDDIDVTAFLWVSLNDCEFAIAEFFDGLDLSIEVIITKFTDQNPVRVFLNKINLTIEVPIAFNLDEFVVLIGFDNVGATVAVGVDGDLVVVFIDPVYPLVRVSVAVAVRNRAIRFPAAGDEAESQQCENDRGFPHASLYRPLNLFSTLLPGADLGRSRASVGWRQAGASADPHAVGPRTGAAGYGPATITRQSISASFITDFRPASSRTHAVAGVGSDLLRR
jgi:hypothetical protein